MGFVGSLSVGVFFTLKKFKLLRVSFEDEMATMSYLAAKETADMDGSTYKGQMYNGGPSATPAAVAEVTVTTT